MFQLCEVEQPIFLVKTSHFLIQSRMDAHIGNNSNDFNGKIIHIIPSIKNKTKQ